MEQNVKKKNSTAENEVIRINMGFVNSYIIKGSNQVILVDTGIHGNAKRIIKKIEDEGFKPEQVSLIILTHAHADHTGSVVELKKITGAKVAIHKNDAPYLMEGKSAPVIPISGAGKVVAGMIKNRPVKIGTAKPDIFIEDEMDLNEFGIKGKVILTPGHTEGSVSIFLDSGNCIVGDMIGASFGKPTYGMFCMDLEKLKESIDKIKSSNAKKVYLSHNGTISIEKIRKTL
jgi:hydroxyacylglutathione hydrolase